MFNIFAAEPHTVISAEKLFTIGGITVTNSMLYGWICAILLISLFLAARKRIKLGGTKGPAQIVEYGVESIVGILQSTLGTRERAVKYAPTFVTLFFFIMLNNWLGLLPGIGPAIEYNGSPLFRAFTADLNSTIAMALFGMITVQIIAIKESGVGRHGKHYFPGSLFNPLTYLIGAFEIFTEFTRLLSLGLRLFLNVAIGEILISVAANLGGPAASITALPFTLLEIFVGALQAYIFMVLCTAYLAAATSHNDEHDEVANESIAAGTSQPHGEPLV